MSGHGAPHHDPSKKGIAVLITLLAAFLAISETAGKSAQTASIAHNIEASNLWSFFQAKTIRMTVLRTAGEELEMLVAEAPSPARTEAINKRIADWKATADRYDTEPSTGEGRRELAARAKVAEEKRDRTLAAYHLYELASAAFQLAIVLASASMVTGMIMLAFGAGGLTVIGVVMAAIGWLAPTLIHF